MATQPAIPIDFFPWLDAHCNLELTGRRATPTLERISGMVELLGSPQRAYPLLHITGTHGKTSVTRMVARLLGPTRACIAAEKAGIVKPGATLVLGEPDPLLRHFFLDRGPGRVLVRDEGFGVIARRPGHDGQLVDLRTPGGEYRNLHLPLHGAFQAGNAACAVTAAEAFLDAPLKPEMVVEALAGMRSPGRLEVVCSPPTPGAFDPEALAGAALEVGVAPTHLEVATNVAEALDRAFAITPADGQVVVTGSLYLVGEARRALVTHPRGLPERA